MLVRYCARFTGDPLVAEDLAQQTLLEAWQKSDTLYNRQVRAYWLLGIARNVCLRWVREHGAAVARLMRLAEPAGEIDKRLADDFDLEVELEQDDLARLLDRALALLPAETREILVQKYIEESPQADVAGRLGLTEGAVEARLQRGKLALRRVLTTDLRDEAVAYGLIAPDDAGWQQTRLWCADCGERRLLGRFGEAGDLQLDCPSCLDGRRLVQVRGWVGELIWGITSIELLAGVTGYKAALNRMRARNYAFYRHGTAGRTARCRWCGRQAPLRISRYEFRGNRDIRADCPHCGGLNGVSTVGAVAFDRPEGWAFEREHRRIRTLPGREVEAAGVPAIVVRFASVTGSARLEVVLACDTLEVIGVHGAPISARSNQLRHT
jgi:RNA polymerase sigma-70 factor (ECF subfamily)